MFATSSKPLPTTHTTKTQKATTSTTIKTMSKIKKKTIKSTIIKSKVSTSPRPVLSTTSGTTSLSMTKTDSFLENKEVQNYMYSVFRRLNNFERLLKLKMDKFHETKTYVDAKPRLVFLMTYEDLVRMYIDRQKKKQTMKHITSGFKLTATIALLSLCHFLVYSLKTFKIIMEQSYTKKKAAKEKRKRRAKREKRRKVLSEL